MSNENERKMKITRYDTDQKIFYLKSEYSEKDELAVSCKLILEGTSNGEKCVVKTNKPLTDYAVYRFLNPYLNAQNDLFKIKYNDKSIGYIIPCSAIEDTDGIAYDEFDEPKQAYKYYCVKSILEQKDFKGENYSELINLSQLIDKNSIFAVIYKPQISESDFIIEDFLPSLGLKGYYYFPSDVSPNVLSFSIDNSSDTEFNNLIRERFHSNRNNDSLKIEKTENMVNQNAMMKLLYKKLLSGTGNSLHRFLILYQVIEYLVEKRIRKDIEKVLEQKDVLSNFKFIQKINELNNTRSIINKLFSGVVFEEKEEIKNSLKDFILYFDPEYSSQSIGDCFYDIRNLLFHDFKSVLEKNKDGVIASLVIQCEILIHRLLISMSKEL